MRCTKLSLFLYPILNIPDPAPCASAVQLSAGSVADWLLEGAISAAGRVSVSVVEVPNRGRFRSRASWRISVSLSLLCVLLLILQLVLDIFYAW